MKKTKFIYTFPGALLRAGSVVYQNEGKTDAPPTTTETIAAVPKVSKEEQAQRDAYKEMTDKVLGKSKDNKAVEFSTQEIKGKKPATQEFNLKPVTVVADKQPSKPTEAKQQGTAKPAQPKEYPITVTGTPPGAKKASGMSDTDRAAANKALDEADKKHAEDLKKATEK